MSTAVDNQQAAHAGGPALVQWTDEELLLGYRQTGDPDLFAELVHRYERPLYSYLRRYLDNAEMAEDTFQATFLQVHLKCDRFEEGLKVRPWLYTIASNQAIDAQRRNKRHRMVSLDRVSSAGGDEDFSQLIDLLTSSEPNPLVLLDADERGRQIREAVQQLPELMISVVRLVYFQGLKYREAADVLSIPVGTVKSRLHSAIMKLCETCSVSQ